MAKAASHSITTASIPVSELFTDPRLREAFQRAERDDGTTFVVPVVKPQSPLTGGAEAVPEGRFSPEYLSQIRSEVVADIERMIAFLDRLDAYSTTELEADADFEPSLGAFENHDAPAANWRQEEGHRHACDAEVEDEHDEANGDLEPSLGAREAHPGPTSIGIDQAHWSAPGTDDREDEHDGSEPPEDAEPSLGSFDRMMDQSKGWKQSARNFWNSGNDHELACHAPAASEERAKARHAAKRNRVPTDGSDGVLVYLDGRRA